MSIHLFQRTHINHEPIPHIALQHALVRLVNFLDRNHLNVAPDVVLAAKIEHLLSFADSPNLRTCDTATPGGERECPHRNVFLRQSYNHHGPIQFQQVQILAPVNLRGYRIDDEIEGTGKLRECFWIRCRIKVICSQPFAISLLGLIFLTYTRRTVRGHPGRSLLMLIIAYLLVMIASPETNTLRAGMAQTMLYVAVMAPVFWAPLLVRSKRQLQRIMAILLICNGANAVVGVLQVKFPDTFDTPPRRQR